MQAKSLTGRDLSLKALELVESLEAKVSMFDGIYLEKSRRKQFISIKGWCLINVRHLCFMLVFQYQQFMVLFMQNVESFERTFEAAVTERYCFNRSASIEMGVGS